MATAEVLQLERKAGQVLDGPASITHLVRCTWWWQPCKPVSQRGSSTVGQELQCGSNMAYMAAQASWRQLATRVGAAPLT